MEYDYITLSFHNIGKALLTKGLVIEDIIVDREKRTVKLRLAMPKKGKPDAQKD